MEECALLELWREGLRMARRCCAHTLTRLENGDGGFYDADDLLQDLFLEFWQVARAWDAGGSGDERLLWAAWRRRLWRGGVRILRRAPQRLWRREEAAFAPDTLEEAADAADESGARQLRAIERALTQPEDAAAALEAGEMLRSMARAWEALPPVRRRALALLAAGRPAVRVAEALGLPGARSVYAQVRQARAQLQRLRR